MPWDGSGKFTQSKANFIAGTTIDPSVVNAEIDNIVSGINVALTKDGQNTPTVNLPMGGFRHTGVNDAVADTDYAAWGQVKSGVASISYAGQTPWPGSTDLKDAIDKLYPDFTGGWLSAYIPNVSASGLLTANVTVQVPTDYATLQAAFDALSIFRPKAGVTYTINIETGHTPASGITAREGDYRHIIVTSTDATVMVDATFAATYFILAERAWAPTVDVLFDANGQGDTFFGLLYESKIVINSGAGCRNPGVRGLYVALGSTAYATGGIFTDATHDAGGRNVWVTRSSRAIINLADVSRANSHCIYVSRNSQVYGETVTVHGSGAGGSGMGIFTTRNSIAVIHGSTFDDCHNVCRATGGSQITIHDSTGTNIQEDGVVALDGSYCNAEDCTFAGDTIEATTYAVWADEGSTIFISGLTASGFKQAGIFARDGAIVTGTTVTLTGVSGGGSGIRNDGATVTVPGVHITDFSNSVNATDSIHTGIASTASRTTTLTTPNAQAVLITNGGNLVMRAASVVSPGGNAIRCDEGANVDWTDGVCDDAAEVVRCIGGTVTMLSVALTTITGNAIFIDSGATVRARNTTYNGAALTTAETNADTFNGPNSVGPVKGLIWA